MATFNYTTFLHMVLDRITTKSVFLATVNNTSDAALGRLNDGIAVDVEPLSNVTVRNLAAAGAGTTGAALPDFTVDRLVSSTVPVALNQLIYAGFIANGLDAIDFAAEQGANYANFVAQVADQIAAEIDTRLVAGLVAGATNVNKTVAFGSKADVAQNLLDIVQEQIDALDDAGIPGPYVIAMNGSDARKVSPLLENYSFTGDSANTALRQNIIGQLFNAPVIKSGKVPAGKVLVYSKDAAVVANRAAGKSSGAKNSASVRAGNLSFTANLGFDTTKQADVVVVSTIANVGILDANRAKKISLTYATS